MDKKTLEALTATMKTMAIIIAVSVVSALICVGIGYRLGDKQTNSVSSSSEYSEDGWFVTDGEEIEEDDELAWLIPATSDCWTPIKAEAITELTWTNRAEQTVRVNLPDEIFLEDETCDIDVYYPKTVKAGQKGIIAVVIETMDEYAYCSCCEFTAADDLKIVYYNNSGLNTAMSDWIQFSFMPSATDKEIKNHSGYVTRTDEYTGTVGIRFHYFEDLDIEDDDQEEILDAVSEKMTKPAVKEATEATKKPETVKLVAEKAEEWPLTALVGGKPLQSELLNKVQTTDWSKNSNYDIRFSFPDKTFVTDANNDVRVYYPQKIKAGEVGIITIAVKSSNENYYRGYYQFTAKK